MENVYWILQQIYSENGEPNFIRIREFYGTYCKKTFWSFFLDTLYRGQSKPPLFPRLPSWVPLGKFGGMGRVWALPPLESCFYHCLQIYALCTLTVKTNFYLIFTFLHTKAQHIPWRLHVKTKTYTSELQNVTNSIQWQTSIWQTTHIQTQKVYSAHTKLQELLIVFNTTSQVSHVLQPPGKWLENNVLENAHFMDVSLKGAVTTCILFIASLNIITT